MVKLASQWMRYSWTHPFVATLQAVGFTHETAEPASHAVMAAFQAKTLVPSPCHPKNCRQTAKTKTFKRNRASNLSLDWFSRRSS